MTVSIGPGYRLAARAARSRQAGEGASDCQRKEGRASRAFCAACTPHHCCIFDLVWHKASASRKVAPASGLLSGSAAGACVGMHVRPVALRTQIAMQTVCDLLWRRSHRLTAYPACKPEAVLAGAEFVDADDNIPETVVVDGNLVRARKRHAP